MLHSRLLATASLAACLLAACGGDDDGGDTTDGSVFDAGDVFPDGAPVVCTDYAALDLGALEPLPGAEAVDQDNPDPAAGPDDRVLRLRGTGANGQRPDLVEIELWDGLGAFEGGAAAPGTYEISGDEAQVITCGVCIYIYSDATVVDGEVVDSAKDYIATGGSITVDSVTGNFTGSLDGITFTEIDWTSELGTPLEGGCTTAIPSATFDVAITVE
ncbi:MAG TPA: hypothetical protein VFU21_19695 [Kofleriaceae bacterium]|nr:hypothetical protein [Kofleriaceae bacterium]